MANVLYAKGRNKFLRGEISWKSGGDDFRAYLIDLADYPDKNLTTDEFLAIIPAGARVAYVLLVPADPSDGVADADDATFLAVSGDVSEAIVIVKWTGDAATSPLIAYIDSATGLPVTPNGGDIQVVWDASANKIFKL